MNNLNPKQKNEFSVRNEGNETADQKQASTTPVSATEVVKSWVNFEAKVPLTYLVAARKAAREKNS